MNHRVGGALVARSLAVMLLLLSGLSLSVRVLAQAAPETATALAPQVSSELTPAEVAPGQSARLRITVLVPTFMPKPVVFAELDQPQLRVQLGARATTPLSRRIDGRTWSGVTRSYQLTPLAAGQFNLGAQALTVTYQDPDSGEVLSQQVVTEAQTLTATIPAAASGLSPYVAGRAVTLTQRFTLTRSATDGQGSAELLDAKTDDPVELAVGDSLEREITLSIEGGSALLLPALDAQAEVAGMALYVASPQVSEADDGGKRIERYTYIAQAGGSTRLPPMALGWFDTGHQKVATAQLDGLALKVSGASLAAAVERSEYWLVLLLVVAFLLLWAAWYGLRPRWRRHQQLRRRQRDALGVSALLQLRAAVKAQDYAACLQAWYRLEQQASGLSAPRRAAIADALAAIGQWRFGKVPDQAPAALWQALEQALPPPQALRARAEPVLLPGLNPTSAG